MTAESSAFRKRAALAQSAVGTRRHFDFVRHPMLHRIDPSMLGRTRLLTRYEGGVVTVRSDITLLTSSRTRLDKGSFEIEIPGHRDLTGHLLLIGNDEYVVVENVQLKRDFRTFDKYTVLELESGLQRSYATTTSITLAGFPLAPASWYQTGSLELQFDSVTFVLGGDEVAVYSAPDGIPVVGSWCAVESVLSGSGSPGNERYAITLSQPLQQDVTPDNRLFLKAVPGYISPILPVPEDMQRRGSVVVDLMSGKVFGTGTDAVTLSTTTYDANKEVVESMQLNKNDVLDIGTLSCADIVLWRHRVGRTVVESPQAIGATAITDVAGRYQVGITTPCSVAFSLSLESSASFTVTVYTAEGAVATDSVANTAVIDVAYTGAGYVSIALSGSSNQSVTMRPTKQSVIQYLSYGYRVGIDSMAASEAWEGSGLLLKPVFSSLADLGATTHSLSEIVTAPEPGSNASNFNLNSGVLL